MVTRRFVSSPDVFFFTRRGMLLAREFSQRESILGWDPRSGYSWGSLLSLRGVGPQEFVRLLMDRADATFSKNSSIFILGRVMKVSKISHGAIVELANLRRARKALAWDSYNQLVDYSGRWYSLDEAISYVLGLQEQAKEVSSYKIRFFASARVDPLKIVKMLAKWSSKNNLKLRPMMSASSVFVRSRGLAKLCQTHEFPIPPPQIRSNFSCLISFTAGFLDSSLKINRYQNPPFYVQIDIQRSGVLAFFLNVLRLIGITPMKLHVMRSDEGPWCANVFLDEKDIDIIRISKDLAERRMSVRHYSVVKEVLPFRKSGTLLSVASDDEHWSPLVNVVPMRCFS